MSHISIQKLTIRLGQHEVLREINADIKPGEFIGIFGPNGAGKSTLIKAILGLIPISSGSIHVCDKLPGKANSAIGYMPQTRHPITRIALSARSLVSAVYKGSHFGVPSFVHHQNVTRALELAGAITYADQPFYTLSGGEKQRVSFAQALIDNPKILILDEPLSSLDPKHQMLLVDRITYVRNETGATILFIAHDINPLLSKIDRVLYMAGGRAAMGSIEEVISTELLSNLYGTAIHVVKADGRIFIVNAESNVTETTCHG